MKNWDKVEPDLVKIVPANRFTPGRGGRKITCIVRHHNAGANLTTDDVYRIWLTREASAHYQVEANGRIGQLVWDRDTAWHAANLARNQESIGIEHANTGGPNDDWPISYATIDNGAHLAAALCKFYGLGRPKFGVNIRDHKETASTSCPHGLAFGGRYHEQWMRRAEYWYDQMTGAAPAVGKELTGMNAEERAALNDTKLLARECRDLLKEIRYQMCGTDQPGQFPGLPQSGNRTLFDTSAAIAANLKIPGAFDVKER